MSFMSDLKADEKRCKHCDANLYENFGGRHSYHAMRKWEDADRRATIVDVKCTKCDRITRIFYIAEGEKKEVEFIKTPMFKVAQTDRPKNHRQGRSEESIRSSYLCIFWISAISFCGIFWYGIYKLVRWLI